MLSALEVLLPVFVTILLGYGAAWHHRFDEKQVPVLNKMVLMDAVPMSISVGMLKTSRAALRADFGLLAVLIVALAAVFLLAFVLIRYTARWDLATSALQALVIAFPAVPFVGPSLLSPLFGPGSSAMLIVAVALVGNIFIVPFTMVCLSMAADHPHPAGRPGHRLSPGPGCSGRASDRRHRLDLHRPDPSHPGRPIRSGRAGDVLRTPVQRPHQHFDNRRVHRLHVGDHDNQASTSKEISRNSKRRELTHDDPARAPLHGTRRPVSL